MRQCLTTQTLEALVSNRLTPDERLALMPHLGECDTCSATVALLLSHTEGMRPSKVAELTNGERIGRYITVDKVGAGAFGTVYHAFDPQLGRPVAIKVLNDRATSLGLQLVDEARAMARLSHPNVVNVYEVASHESTTFLVMELVPGQTLAEWLAEAPREWHEVVAKFIAAAQGLEGAHAAGLVHGDFKPSNVLVGLEGSVKVADFGLGSATGAPSNEALRGTPALMAPELWAGAAPDALSDQFSFGVALHTALYGTRPFAGSTGSELSAAATRGAIEPVPAAVKARVPRWLQQVVRRTLGPRAQRFASLKALRVALTHDAARTRWVAAVAILAVLTAGSLGVIAFQRAERCTHLEKPMAAVWGEAQRAKVRAALMATSVPFAQNAADQVERSLDAYAAAWASTRHESCEATRNGEQSQALLDAKEGCLEERVLELSSLVEVLSTGKDVVERAAKAAGGLSSISSCRTIKVGEPKVTELPAELRERIAHIRAKFLTGQFEPARADATALLAEVELKNAPMRGEVLLLLARIEISIEKPNEAAEHLREAIVIAEQSSNETLAARASSYLGDVLSRRLGRPAEGLHALNVASAKLTRVGATPELEAELLARLGTTHFILNDYAAAETELRRAIALGQSSGASPISIATTEQVLVNVLGTMHRTDESKAIAKQALQQIESMLGPTHPSTAEAHNTFGGVLYMAGDYAGASQENLTALEIYEKTSGPESTSVAWALDGRGLCLQREGKLEEAEASFARAAKILEKAFGPIHPLLAQVQEHLAGALSDQHQYDKAIALLSGVLKVYRTIEPVDQMAVASVLTEISKAKRLMNQPAEALAAAKEAVALTEAVVGPTDPALVPPLVMAGRAELAARHPAEALAFVNRANGLIGDEPAGSENRAEVESTLGCALRMSRREPERADTLLAQARAAFVKMGPYGEPSVAHIDLCK